MQLQPEQDLPVACSKTCVVTQSVGLGLLSREVAARCYTMRVAHPRLAANLLDPGRADDGEHRGNGISDI